MTLPLFHSINEFRRHFRVGLADRGGKNHGHKSSPLSAPTDSIVDIDKTPHRMLYITRQEIN